MEFKQMLVSDFIFKHVPKKYQSKFNENISLWDGSPDYHQSFYDIDVLEMLLKDAINS